jgi:hypothetical protein
VPPKTIRIVVAAVLAAIGVGALVAIATAAGRGNASVAEYQYPAGAAGATGASGQNAGKMTICHRTHSGKKPWVRITISVHAWPAHSRQGDSQDLSKCGGALSSTNKNTGNGHPPKGNPHTGSGTLGPGNSQGHGHNKP